MLGCACHSRSTSCRLPAWVPEIEALPSGTVHNPSCWPLPAAHARAGAAAGAEERLLAQLARLGFPAGILPGADRQGREELDSLVAALEAGTPTPHPLGHGGSPPDPLLFCAWRLVYASNGTVVTRTPAAQALVAASGVPGVGLKDVVQQLELDADGRGRGCAGCRVPCAVKRANGQGSDCCSRTSWDASGSTGSRIQQGSPTCVHALAAGPVRRDGADHKLGSVWALCLWRMGRHHPWHLDAGERHPGARGVPGLLGATRWRLWLAPAARFSQSERASCMGRHAVRMRCTGCVWAGRGQQRGWFEGR